MAPNLKLSAPFFVLLIGCFCSETSDSLANDHVPGFSVLAKFQKLLLGELGLKKVPDVSKMNVTRKEYHRVLKLYRRKKNYQSRNVNVGDSEAEQSVNSTYFDGIASSSCDPGQYRYSSNLSTTWTLNYRFSFPITMNTSLPWQLDLNWTKKKLSFKIQTSLCVVAMEIQCNGQLSRTAVNACGILRQWRINETSDFKFLVKKFCSGRPSEVKVTCQGHLCGVLECPRLRLVPHQPIATRSRRHETVNSIFKSSKGRTDCLATRGLRKRCCRKSLKLNFRQMKGFDWIISPTVIEIHVCKGKCQYLDNPAHNHALFHGFLHTKKMAPKLCCVPKKLEGVDILHLRDDDPTKLAVSRWENAIVTECACA